jgi:hypothetical protein
VETREIERRRLLRDIRSEAVLFAVRHAQGPSPLSAHDFLLAKPADDM